jgi:hypothetical protein
MGSTLAAIDPIVMGSTLAAIDDTSELYSKSRPTKMYEHYSSSSSFLPIDAISSMTIFSLDKYSEVIEEPFWVAARAIRVLITRACD